MILTPSLIKKSLMILTPCFFSLMGKTELEEGVRVVVGYDGKMIHIVPIQIQSKCEETGVDDWICKVCIQYVRECKCI